MTSNASHFDDEIAAFYALGLERDRLTEGPGVLEFIRTRDLLQRHLPPPPAVVADVGGGPGRYAIWLAASGYRVHLIDPVHLHVEQAEDSARRESVTLASAEVGDARALHLADESVDAVLLLGPLYHLPAREERVRALAEARRVCRPGAVVIAAAISRFAATLDGLRLGMLADPEFAAIAARDRDSGQHRNPTSNPVWFTTAYFHRPEELAAECTEAGLEHRATVAVEGPGWLLSDLEAQLGDERRRTVMLDALAALEEEPALLGVSAHLVAVARKR